MSLLEDYQNIKYICEHRMNIPEISLMQSSNILQRIKPRVNDLYSITANHYLNAGLAGLIHFNLLLNAFLREGFKKKKKISGIFH